MATDKDLIFQSFSKGLDEAQALYQADKNAECMVECQKMLAESALPNYLRIRILCLLVAIEDDYSTAWSYLGDAKVLHRFLQRCNPSGQDAELDKIMTQLSEGLEQLEEMLIEEAPSDEDTGDEEAREEELDAQLDEKIKAMEAAQKAEDELEDIDAEVLGMSKEEMRAITASKAASKNNPKEPRKPQLIGKLTSSTASVSTSAATASAPSTAKSSKWYEDSAHSRAHGFGGDKPFQDPNTKRSPQKSDTVSAEEFLYPGAHGPVLGRARSLRKKPTLTKKELLTSTLPARAKTLQDSRGAANDPSEADSSRPPAVLPKFAVELFGEVEDAKK
ncbi:hypothetical protein CB0940_02844 [Cercospora beticola]|uniref:Uncharacterized protein n=1 Tax=Cercospora beticola TaxID=122368 RepID=A0A2G5I4I3_CERBT|nr:hypothetical protein CB0940_02844 [Cercospora beticola]PIA99690.1 hypothetical protein CB0940_02844 [Cercospora beticola]WPA99994.1 hypothetical protein RHO25_004614 [Cercospora beticola]CAK1361828.1 unnamed protein product [Cercospora beticola]